MVRFAVNAPGADAVPLSTLLSVMVGVPVVFQHTPYEVGLGVPKFWIFPFAVTVVALILLTV